jgi:hypothetical protein
MPNLLRLLAGSWRTSTEEAQNQRQRDRADQAGDKDPSSDRRVQDDLAASRFLGGIRLLRRRRRLRWTFSDHAYSPLVVCAVTMKRRVLSSVPPRYRRENFPLRSTAGDRGRATGSGLRGFVLGITAKNGPSE